MSTHTILHVDDEPTDALLVRRAFSKANPDIRVLHVPDGREALDYLFGATPFQNRLEFPFPEIMLLDLKMPLMDGFEVLASVRQRPDTRDLPVVVLTSSNLPEDRLRARQLGATAYIVKSAFYEDLVQQSVVLLSSRMAEPLISSTAAPASSELT